MPEINSCLLHGTWDGLYHLKCPTCFPGMKKLPVEPKSSNANAVQHGGSHYKDCPIQPWDYIAANQIGYFEGCAIKYLTRWKAKGGVEDLRKARHFIEKLIELETKEGDA